MRPNKPNHYQTNPIPRRTTPTSRDTGASACANPKAGQSHSSPTTYATTKRTRRAATNPTKQTQFPVAALPSAVAQALPPVQIPKPGKALYQKPLTPLPNEPTAPPRIRQNKPNSACTREPYQTNPTTLIAPPADPRPPAQVSP